MRLINKCPVCDKVLEQVGTARLGSGDGAKVLNTYKCGHMFAADALAEVQVEELDFDAFDASGHTARPYQREGIKFILDTDFNAIIGDQMRLGKTPQALLALRNKYKERTPCLEVVRATNLWQWIREHKKWADPSPLGIYPIIGTKAFIPPGFHTYIISMDTIGRPSTCQACTHSENTHNFTKNGDCIKCNGRTGGKPCKCIHFTDAHDSMLDKLREIPFKLIIVDEAHSLKNTDSQRSRAIVSFLAEKNTADLTRTLYWKCPLCKHEWEAHETYKVINGVEQRTWQRGTYCEKCNTRIASANESQGETKRNCGIVLLTGTAIKNRADELFVPLNLVAPTKVTSLKNFQRDWLMQNEKGQYARINPYRYEAFKAMVKPHMLRREKEDVYKDLPALNRMFTLIEPEKSKVTEEYNKVLDKLDEQLAARVNPDFWDMKENVMELRRLCGIMKTMWTADYAEACLNDSDNIRIAIGMHHKDVRDILKFKLSHLGVLSLTGEDSAERKDWIMTHFDRSPERLLVVNMLAGGVGLDMWYVPKVIVLERQWNFADEQQFEFRFFNPDKGLLAARGMPNKITDVEYIIAKDTIDNVWHDMVENKKMIQGETIGTNWDFTEQPKFFQHLIEETLKNRL